METSKVILTKALKIYESSSTHEKLSNLLKQLESKSFNVLVESEKEEEVYAIGNAIYDIIVNSLYSHKKADNEQVNETAQIIFTIKEYLKKGISEGDVIAILLFLMVNCYLQIKIKALLSVDELAESNLKLISKKIAETLKSIKVTIKPLPKAPYHENEMVKEYQIGLANNDIGRTYRLIEGIERGGRGFYSQFLLKHLFSLLYQLHFTYFITVLSHWETPTDFVPYLLIFEKEAILTIAKEPSLSNKWLNFELIRKIIEQEKEDSDSIETIDIEAINSILERIRIHNFDFFKQTITYFHGNKLFNAALGAFLVTINNTQIEEVISECFVIDKYDFHLAARDIFRKQFEKTASEEQYIFLLTLVFNKWRTYVDTILSTIDFYQNGLLLTDFANFVILYHTHLTDESRLITMMNHLINKIKFIDSEWFISQSHQLTQYYLYHSELFLLTFAFKNKGLNEPELSKKYNALITHKIQLARYRGHIYAQEKTTNSFQQGKQNFLKEEVVEDKIDEWMYFLKKSEIKDEFNAKGLEEAKTVLNYQNMSPEDQYAYKRHIENRRIEMGVTETAEDRGARRKAKEFALGGLKKGLSIADVAEITQLSENEVLALSRGEDIDKED